MSKVKEESAALVTQGASNYAVLARDPNEVREIIEGNLAGGAFSVRDLETIKVPSGGGTSWDVPTEGGTRDAAKVIDCIIVARTALRRRWAGEYGKTEKMPPLCVSEDGIEGHGDPGGVCKDCAFAKFGPGHEKPECGSRAIALAIFPWSFLPVVIDLPLKSAQHAPDGLWSYMTRLATRGIHYHGVMTRIDLVNDKNKGGLNYSRARFAQGETLSSETKARIDAYAKNVEPLFRSAAAAAAREPDEPEAGGSDEANT